MIFELYLTIGLVFAALSWIMIYQHCDYISWIREVVYKESPNEGFRNINEWEVLLVLLTSIFLWPVQLLQFVVTTYFLS